MIQHKLIYREVFFRHFHANHCAIKKMAKGNARLLNGKESLSHNGKIVKTNSNKRPQTECKPLNVLIFFTLQLTSDEFLSSFSR